MNHRERMDLEEALSELVLGLLRPESLPAVCMGAMLAGRDSPSLATLAGETLATLDPVDARGQFEAAVRELGLPMPSQRQAAELLIERAASRALRHEAAPREMLARIVIEIHSAYGGHDRRRVGDSLGLARLVGLYWEYTELGERWARSVAEVDAEALEALQEYIDERAARQAPLRP